MWETLLDVLLDVLKDSAITFAVILVVNFIVSFIEGKLANKITINNKLSPLIGAGIGLIPQCGFSVVAADMYHKRHITMGTLVAVFIACSDEALPILLTNPSKIIMVIPLLGIKLVVGFLIGFLLDSVFGKQIKKIQINEEEHHEEEKEEHHHGCCHHEIEDDGHGSFVKEHIVHPLIHSLKILAYVFVINMIFSCIIAFVGEDVISNFLNSNIYLTPTLAIIVGLIPNCASSVIITELFVQGSISFGATVGGLIVNAGIGLVFILKDTKRWKENLIIISTILLAGFIVGYGCLLIELCI